MNGWRWLIAQWLERRWWLKYLADKDRAQYLQWKRAYWDDFLKRCQVQPQPGQRVLDAGCGPAGVFIALPQCRLTLLDPLAKHYAEAGMLSEFVGKLHAATLEEFQASEPFPYVFCTNAINHVRSLPQAFSALCRATAPGGTLVLSVDAHRHTIAKVILRLLPFDVLHPHQFSLSEYEMQLKASGFKPERTLLVRRQFLFDYYAVVCSKM